jgi:hypothetical protein
MPTSGPIVRTGPTPKFWENWEQAFGKKGSGTKPARPKKKAAARSAKRATKKKSKSTAKRK